MPRDSPFLHRRPHAVVIGAGIGGLASALRLCAAGMEVTVLERHDHLGGKIRTMPSAAGPVDAGPTVLTMRHVFDDLFATLGARLEDHVTLVRQEVLARHFWPGGATLDLFADPARSTEAVRAFAGDRSAREFEDFCARARRLFEAFDALMMRAARPDPLRLTRHVMARPALIPAMAPLSTLATALRRQFSDPRLAQLFGRYATYVGGAPDRAPAILALIWQAEAMGVWVVEGGMHRLAAALAALAEARGVTVRTGAHVDRIELRGGRARAVHLADGTRIAADVTVFNGDPRALATGRLGHAVAHVARPARRAARSLSARVYSFAAAPAGPDLAHHNVFFDGDPLAEFRDLAAGRVPASPSLYLCAQDRGLPGPAPELERFEMIVNAPPLTDADTETPTHTDQELASWHRTIMQKMAGYGVSFTPTPDPATITPQSGFAQMFPASNGALYGQSPHGLTAAFARPTARTAVPGLYLAGGGTHPGAGVPMATLSAMHAAEAIVSDLTSTSRWAPTAMPGGMSTA